MSYRLPEVSLMQVKQESGKGQAATFVIEPLSPGFGLTVGNALRRVLLSSLGGSAITSIRIDGVSHEFSTIKGVRQDVVDIILNLKQLRLSNDSADSQVIVLDVKGPKKVTAADFKCPTGVKIINKDLPIAELTDGGKMLLEATVEHGRGYMPTELRREEKLPIGVIAIDAAFSPVTKVNFQTEHTRVGKMTNFDKLVLEVETDGSITPQQAVEQSAGILVDHFSVISGSSVAEMSSVGAEIESQAAEDEASTGTEAETKKAAKKSVASKSKAKK